MYLLMTETYKWYGYLEALIFRFRFSPFPFQNLINSVFFRFPFCISLMYFPLLSLSLSLSLSQTTGLKNVLQNKACQNIFYIFSLYVYYEISNEHWN